MFDAITDHVVIPFGDNQMGLYDAAAIGEPIVTANRTNGTWTIHADGVDDATADTRKAAISALTAHALTKLGPSGPNGEGYSCTVPHGLREQP